METNIDYVRLVKQAQLGDKASLDRLAEAVRGRLYAYVYRYTLADDLAQDIVQEAILKMYEVLGELKEADRFWPWLFKIALSKVLIHRRAEKQRRGVSGMAGSTADDRGDKQTAIANMVGQELKEIVFSAIQELKPNHRTVINMRCYDEMPYSEIAKAMGCSEFAAQMLFYRAKKSLKKQLVRRGFGKGSLLMALVLFGKLTAPSEAAAAEVSVAAASTKVGLGAAAIGLAGSKAVIVPLATAGVVAVGSIVATSGPEGSVAVPVEKPAVISPIAAGAEQADESIDEYWYYYPSKVQEAVMMRLMQGGRCVVRQNESGNYYFGERGNSICVENYRAWNKDLSVWRLPTDSLRLREFLSQVEGRGYETEYVPGRGNGLLVIAKRDAEASDGHSHMRTTYQYNVLDEEYFRYNLPAGTKIVDNRDAMHKRGWTYFKIAGRVNGKKVKGVGRMPFIYTTSKLYSPWLRLQVGEDRIVDAGGGALFKGLGRPWMGLHTIDTVRRDAAEKQIRFETELSPEGDKACVTLTHNKGKLVYTIDMERDVIEEIRFSGQGEGELRFSYLEEVDEAGGEFVRPRRKSYRELQQKSEGMLWLVRLGRGELNAGD